MKRSFVIVDKLLHSEFEVRIALYKMKNCSPFFGETQKEFRFEIVEMLQWQHF